MVCFLYRPSPQISRPSANAAKLCFDACEYNIYMTRRQIETKSVDMTWIFTQAIFMVVNVMLWSLSYSEVRRNHTRDEVERHLNVALESIELASERWPGVTSALELYQNLIGSCMRIFDKDGDIPISAGSPSDSASVVSSSIVEGINRSRTTSPATASTASVSTPSENTHPPFGYLPPGPSQPLFSFNTAQTNLHSSPSGQSVSLQTTPQQFPSQSYMDTSPKATVDNSIPAFNYPPTTQYTPMPSTFAELPHWNPTFSMPPQEPFSMSPASQPLTSPIYNEHYAANQGFPMTDYLYPQWSQEDRGVGLNHEQQMQLMQDYEANETSHLKEIIQQSHQLFRPYAQYT
jgi:hypothetical protein